VRNSDRVPFRVPFQLETHLIRCPTRLGWFEFLSSSSRQQRPKEMNQDDTGQLVGFGKGTPHNGGVPGFGGVNKIYVLQRRADRRASTHKVKNPRGRPPIIVTPRPTRQVNGSGYGMNHAQRNVHSLPAGAPANSSIAAARNQVTMNGAAHPRAMLIASRPLRLPSDCQRRVPERISLTRTAQPRRVRDLNTAPPTAAAVSAVFGGASTILSVTIRASRRFCGA